MALPQQHRIIIYTTCYNVLDGVTLTIRKLEQEILAAGHSVCILTTLSGDPSNTHLDGQHPSRRVLFMDNAIPIPFVHDPNNPDLTYQIGFSLSRSVQQQLDDFEPSLIHITVPDCTALHLIGYARRKEIPIMGTYHSNIPEYMDHYPGMSWLKPILGGLFRHQYNFMQALYVPTPFIKRHLTDTYELDKATRLGVWGRGVDIERFHPHHRFTTAGSKFRAQLSLAEGDVVLCWVGRLVPEKRVDIFCDTVRRLHTLGLPFRALVVGAGPCEEDIKSLPNTTFCGWMDADQLAVAYAASDIFLFPSSVETFGNVTLEAMASGLPVVVEAGCSGHLVEEGINGYACPADDADAFFQATRALVQDEDKRRLFSQNSRDKAEQLEKSSVVRQMVRHYGALTHEFMTEYGGHHSNRDKTYSFRGGNYPRPTIFVMVEWLFIVLFQVLWNLSQVFVWAQDSMLSRGGVAASAPPPIAAPTMALPQETTSSSSSTSKYAKLRQSDPLLSPEENSNDIDAPESAPTTARNQDEDEPSRRKRRCEDIAFVLALSFVQTMEFVCRMESHLRNGLSSCRVRTLGGLRLKRKNSFDLSSTQTTTSKTGEEEETSSSSRHGNASSNTVMVRRGVSSTAEVAEDEMALEMVSVDAASSNSSTTYHHLQIV